MRAVPVVLLIAVAAFCSITSCNNIDSTAESDHARAVDNARLNVAADQISIQPGSDNRIEAIITNFTEAQVLPVTWVSEAPGIATVVQESQVLYLIDAIVHGVAPGETWIRAFIPGGNAAARDSLRVIVLGTPQPQIGLVRLEPAVNPLALVAGDTFAVIVAVQNAANASVSYTSSNPNAVRFVKRGNNAWVEVLSKVQGAVTLRASIDGTTAAVAQDIKINPVTIYDAALSEHALTLFQTATKTLGCTFTNRQSHWTFAWDSTRWSSSNPALASVDGSGKVTANANGASRIYCRLRDADNADSATVTVHSMRLVVSPNPAALRVGGVAQLAAQLKDETDAPITGQRISYASNNPLVARIDTPDVLRAVEAGNATVRASVVGFTNVFVDIPVTVQSLPCGPTGANITTLRTQVVTDPGNQAATVNMPGTLAISIARTSNVFTVSAAAPFSTVTGAVDPQTTVCGLFLNGTTTIGGAVIPVELAGAYPPAGVQEWTFRVLMPSGTVTYRLLP